MAERFYLSFPIRPGPVLIQGPEARHIATVLRILPGDAICLFTGDGREHRAIVQQVGKRDVTVIVEESRETNSELPFRLEVAAAVPKGDRAEWLAEKLTELGVTRFVPLRTERSIVHPKGDRLSRTVIEASKQCGRNVLMEISDITAWDEYCCQGDAGLRLLAHPRFDSSTRVNVLLAAHAASRRDIKIAIGPEGGFTSDEVNRAVDAGWRVVDLGPRVLRIETAAVALAGYVVLGSASTA